MSGFVSLPPSIDCEEPDPARPEVVQSDGWWPDIDITALRDVERIDTNTTPERLKEAIVNAMIALAQDLASWRSCQEEAGFERLFDVAAPKFNGRSRFVTLYERAIGATVKADLYERSRDIGATAAGHDREEELMSATGELRRTARYAIRMIKGQPGLTAELL